MTSARARNWPGEDPLTPAERSCLGAARDPVMLLARNMVDVQWASFITADFRFKGLGRWYSTALLLSCLREWSAFENDSSVTPGQQQGPAARVLREKLSSEQ